MKNRPTTEPYQAVFSDMDGTLLDREHRIPPRNLAAIAYLRTRGIPFVLASGRPSYSMRRYHQDIDGGDMICLNGAQVLDKHGNILRDTALDNEQIRAIRRVLPRGDQRYAIHYYHHLDWYTETPADSSVQFEKNITGREPRLDCDNLHHAHKIMISGTAEDILTLQNTLRAELTGLDIYRSHRCYLEIMHPQSGKGKAMAFLAERYGIPLSACIALGDNDNDIGMLRRAGLAVVMDNAEDSVKSHAHIIAAPHHQSGFADIIEKHII